MKITILDYGAGNVPSVERALQRLGVESQRTSSPESISRAEALLLPGVGHYAALVRALDEKQFRNLCSTPSAGACLFWESASGCRFSLTRVKRLLSSGA